jgi:hypothetical protein
VTQFNHRLTSSLRTSLGMFVAACCALLVSSTPGVTPEAAAANPTLAVSQNPAPPGAAIKVAGTNFPARAAVVLTWDGSTTGMPQASTSADGSFNISVTIPQGATFASHTIAAKVRKLSATATVQVVPGTPMPTPTATQGPLTTYPLTILADQPAAYWRLGEASGNAALDASGHSVNGPYAGGVTLGAGGALSTDADKAIALDGTSGYVDLGDPLALQPASSISVEAWVKTSASGVGEQHIVRKRWYGYSLNIDTGSGLPRFWVYGGPNGSQPQITATGSTRVNNGSWHHLVGTYDGTIVRLFVDGALVGSSAAPQPGGLAYQAGGVAIGRDGDNAGSYFQGSLDEVAIYAQALPNASVQAHYRAGGGTALTATPTPTPAPAPAAVVGTVYWQDGFETGDFSRWVGVHDGTGTYGPCGDCGNAVASIVSSPTYSGTYAAKLQNNYPAGYRVEVGNSPSTNYGSEGQDTYYGFAVYFSSINRGNWMPNSWDSIGWFQFIAVPDGEPIGAGVDTGDFDVFNPHLFINCNVDSAGNNVGRACGRWQDPDPVPYDTWITFVFHVKWTTGTNGLVEMWKNGTQIFSRQNIRTLIANPVYMEFQNYEQPAGTTTNLFDAFRIGSTYAAVNPASGR